MNLFKVERMDGSLITYPGIQKIIIHCYGVSLPRKVQYHFSLKDILHSPCNFGTQAVACFCYSQPTLELSLLWNCPKQRSPRTFSTGRQVVSISFPKELPPVLAAVKEGNNYGRCLLFWSLGFLAKQFNNTLNGSFSKLVWTWIA